MQILRLSLPLSLAAGAFGCDDLEAVSDSAIDAEREFRGGKVACPKCQFNAAHIGDAPFSYLDLTGERNEHGISARYLVDPKGQRYTLAIRSEELAAYDGSHLVAIGGGLVGWRMLVDVDGEQQFVTIHGRTTQPSFAENGKPISLYALSTPDAEHKDVNLCPGFKPINPALTIIHGETYDPELKQIDRTGPQWVTFACADEAAYKIKRFGYGPNGNQGPGGGPATPAQRTAALKMVTGDYCGTGESFTADDTQVFWMNVAETVTSPDVVQSVGVESFWDEHGALCITHPRHATIDEIAAVCKLPTCDSFPGGATWEWRSWVPK